MTKADAAGRPKGRGPVIQGSADGSPEKGRAKAAAWAAKVHFHFPLGKLTLEELGVRKEDGTLAHPFVRKRIGAQEHAASKRRRLFRSAAVEESGSTAEPVEPAVDDAHGPQEGGEGSPSSRPLMTQGECGGGTVLPSGQGALLSTAPLDMSSPPAPPAAVWPGLCVAASPVLCMAAWPALPVAAS